MHATSGKDRGAEYYRGMVTSGVSDEDAAKDMMTPTLKLAGASSVLLAALLALFFAANVGVPPANAATTTLPSGYVYEPRGVTPQDSAVFVVGCVPFIWATWEFWRRIAVGASFGTGKDSIVIDPTLDPVDEDQIRRNGGKRVLGQGALLVAYVLFAAAGGSVALALFAATQV